MSYLEKKNKIKAFKEGWAWTERPWSQISEDTGVGNPKAASAAKGARFFKAICHKLGELFYEVATADTQNLYA